MFNNLTRRVSGGRSKRKIKNFDVKNNINFDDDFVSVFKRTLHDAQGLARWSFVPFTKPALIQTIADVIRLTHEREERNPAS